MYHKSHITNRIFIKHILNLRIHFQANTNETLKQKEDLASEVGRLRLDLQLVRDDRDRQLSKVEDLSKEVSKYKEWSGKSSDEIENLTSSLLSSQAICSSQSDQIKKLQQKLTTAESKLEMSDVSAFEIKTGYEEQKKINSDLQLRLAEAELKHYEGELLRKKLHNTILVSSSFYLINKFIYIMVNEFFLF